MSTINRHRFEKYLIEEAKNCKHLADIAQNELDRSYWEGAAEANDKARIHLLMEAGQG